MFGMQGSAMERFVVLSGCSGGGKSTLLAELGRRGHAVVEEPGRRIVAEETLATGRALPWIDMAAFARRAVEVARRDRVLARAMPRPGYVFFDRGLIDAAAALDHSCGQAACGAALRAVAARRYNRQVFLTPPWPQIYASDEARRHGLDEAIAEYERLLKAYGALGYEPVVLPRVPVGQRADFVLRHLVARTDGV